jgi:hypothetical protein
VQPDATAGELVALEAVQQQEGAGPDLVTQPILPSVVPPPAPKELPALPKDDPLVVVYDISTYDGKNEFSDALGMAAVRCEMLSPTFLTGQHGSTWHVFMLAVDDSRRPQRIWSVHGDQNADVRACVARAVLDAVIPGPVNRVTAVELDPSARLAGVSAVSEKATLPLPYADYHAIDVALAARAAAIFTTCYAPMLRQMSKLGGSVTLDVQVAGGAITSARVTDTWDPAAGGCAARLISGTSLPPLSKPPPAHFVVDVTMRPAH